MKSVSWFAGRDAEGHIYTFPAAKSGNRIYAYRMKERIENALDDMHMESGDCLFITLTAQYEKTESGITASWTKNWKELPRLLQRVRRMGFKSYTWVREAHADGGCHVHLIIKYPSRVFPHFQDKKDPAILRLDDEELRSAIKAAWYGHVDIQVITSEGAGQYLAKEVGKAGHIETAIARFEKGNATAADAKKLWAHYMANKLKMRRWGVSRDLIKHMTNPTEQEFPQEFILIPERIRNADYFEPITQILDPKSRIYLEIKSIFDTVNAIGQAVRKNHEIEYCT